MVAMSPSFMTRCSFGRSERAKLVVSLGPVGGVCQNPVGLRKKELGMGRRSGAMLGKKESEASTKKESEASTKKASVPESLIFFPKSFEDQSDEGFPSLDWVMGSMRGIVVCWLKISEYGGLLGSVSSR